MAYFNIFFGSIFCHQSGPGRVYGLIWIFIGVLLPLVLFGAKLIVKVDNGYIHICSIPVAYHMIALSEIKDC